jgi:hypothetical protein
MPELPPFDVPDDAMVEILRRMTPVQRLTVANNMWVSARKAIECMLRSDHPDWDDEQLRREIARRMLRGSV